MADPTKVKHELNLEKEWERLKNKMKGDCSYLDCFNQLHKLTSKELMIVFDYSIQSGDRFELTEIFLL